jgi:hypothetical protein
VLHEGEASTVLQAVTTNLPKNSDAENERLLEENLMAINHVIQNVIKAPLLDSCLALFTRNFGLPAIIINKYV